MKVKKAEFSPQKKAAKEAGSSRKGVFRLKTTKQIQRVPSSRIGESVYPPVFSLRDYKRAMELCKKILSKNEPSKMATGSKIKIWHEEDKHLENHLSLIHICRCRRYAVCRSRWSPYH
eukprot:TRINITY_DN22373_c0_g1_i1.p1 TRINITY_DN22373_c0_g1~~TRINITY_DN22373_c0_g1_i1.p1  ORF type:complete len:118 (+),score=17.48 TRINITY_DN22373_c0_g1_i1:483-836(+)